MIGIIGAMKEEVDAVLTYCDIKQTVKILDYEFIEGTIEGKDVVVLQGGIGKVNAAICTSVLFNHYDIDFIINVGSAGGLQLSENVGDVVISKYVAYHDLDLTAFGRPVGELPDMPRFIPADEKLISLTEKILKELNVNYHIGLIVSGDQFVGRDDQVDMIKSVYEDAKCSEMEAAAVGHVCYKFHVPFIITRSLSDVFGKGESSIQFDEYLKVASLNSAKLCVELIKNYTYEK